MAGANVAPAVSVGMREISGISDGGPGGPSAVGRPVARRPRLPIALRFANFLSSREGGLMKAVSVPDPDYDRITLLARAWEVSEGEVVRRLLDRFLEPSPPAAAIDSRAGDEVAIYADYKGQHIDAVFHRTTKRVDITTGALAGRSYKSPSGAAIGIVQALNPSVHPNRNGWLFWFLKANGETLRSLK
jgi:hypothetical protein